MKYYIPDRHAQGYGFHHKVARKITSRSAKCDLLVIVDCGTQDTQAIGEIRACGIPVIVFDHHLARGRPADADALINPHIDGSDLGRDLCAAGVVWCWAWKHELAPREWLAKRLDLAALATVADCVPMSSPVNRAIVREGTKALRVTERDGLRKLMQRLEIDPFTVDCASLSMKIIPCLNAAGRLEHADTAMGIFFPREDVDVSVQKLILLNKKRRDYSAKIISDVDSGACDNPKYKYVLFGDDWPAGVLSSVASHVCAGRDSPIVLAANAQEPFIRGTLRVPPGVDAEAILGAISEDLDSWGGHRMAAGFSVERGKWANVRDKLEEILSGIEVCSDKEDILCWRPAELALDEWKDAERLGPFGIGNPYPKLFCEHSGPIRAEPLGRNGSHVKILLDGRELLGFSGANLLDAGCSPSGWVYKPRVNFWRSSENLQLVLERIVTSAA
ncbi:phosphoesterase RecJ [Synergistales bacterium]|nr:phosphoesterase RecJ [Synergistales bacterium]